MRLSITDDQTTIPTTNESSISSISTNNENELTDSPLCEVIVYIRILRLLESLAHSFGT